MICSIDSDEIKSFWSGQGDQDKALLFVNMLCWHVPVWTHSGVQGQAKGKEKLVTAV